MNPVPQRDAAALFVLVALLFFLPFAPKAVSARQVRLRAPAAGENLPALSPLLIAQSEKKIKIGVFSFNALNISAAGYDASISNMFMTLLGQHRIFQVMNRKELEESLRRAGLQQSEEVSVVQAAGTHLGLDMIIVGNIKKDGSAIGFEFKLVEMSRGQSLLHYNAEVFGDIALRQKVEEITRQISQIAHTYQPTVEVEEEIPLYPEAPSGLQARGGSRKVTLYWTANKEPNLSGYKVFRSTGPMGPFGKVASVTKNTYTDTELENNRIYHYKVQAFNKEGREGPPSAVIATETAPTPFSPIILEARPLIGGIRIRWTNNPLKGEKGTEVAGFKVYRAGEPEGEYQAVVTVTVKTGPVQKLGLAKYDYEDAGLADGTSYYYRLTAFNERKIESDFSSALEGTTVSRPTALQAAGDMIREVHLQWHPSPFPAVNGYRIYRSTSANGNFQRVDELVGINKTTFVDTKDLKDATTYFYQVTAFDKQGRESGPSGTVSAVTRGKPPTPEGLTAQSGQVKKVTLSWKVRPEKEVEGYYLYWNSAPAGEFKQITQVKGREKITHVDKGGRDRPLDDNSTCYYMITSYNKVDVKSDPSPPVSATTKARPQAPGDLAAQGGLPRKVVLTWKPNPEPDIEVFHLWRQENGRKFKEIKKVPADQTRFENDGLEHGTAYGYRLQAEDADDLLSDYSEVVEATTKPLPQPPTGLEVNSLPQGFVLHWEPNPEPDIVTYKIYLRSFLADKEIGSTDKIPFTITTLDSDKEYTVTVTAVDQDGLESNKSEPITLRTK